MLQKELNSLRTNFYHDVEKLGFTSPVANIAQKTGYAKGNISSILNRKLEPSEQFIKKFYESFKEELEGLQQEQFEQDPQPIDGKQRNIDKLIRYLDNKHIDIAEFERTAGISNAYLRNTEKRGADLTLKILDRIKEKQPKIYCEVFEENPVTKKTEEMNTSTPPPQEPAHNNNNGAGQYIDLIIKMNEHLLKVNQQLLDSQAKRDNTEAIYAQAHKLLAERHSEVTHLNAIAERVISAIKLSLDESNLHFSRITEAMVENQVRMIENQEKILQAPVLATEPSTPAKVGDSQPFYNQDSK